MWTRAGGPDAVQPGAVPRRFVVPSDDGVPITGRMDDVGLAGQVPPQLLDLD